MSPWAKLPPVMVTLAEPLYPPPMSLVQFGPAWALILGVPEMAMVALVLSPEPMPAAYSVPVADTLALPWMTM